MSIPRLLAIFSLLAGLLLTLSRPGTGVVLAAPAGAGCVSGGYSTTASKCVTVPASGKFSIKIPHSKAVLTGSGVPSMAGTKIHVVAVANPPHTSGIAIRVTASGKFPPLRVKPGKLSRYNPATGKLISVRTVTKSGIYLVKL
jgi:hypothetical protein